MRLYDSKTAPGPRRARMFLAEKGLGFETVEVDLGQGEQLGDAFRRINPRCIVPVLELDDGTCLTENAGIAAYLEAMAPEPPLLGRTPKEKGLVATWNARVEQEGFWPVSDALRNRAKGLVGRAITGPTGYEQIPALAERSRARVLEFFDMLDERLGTIEYVAGEAFSVADITALVTIDFAGWVKLAPADHHVNTKRWSDAVRRRSSASC